MIQGSLQRKVETKRNWEATLRPYENHIKYLKRVLSWERPIDFAVLIALVTFTLWFVLTLESTLITIAATFSVGYFLGIWIIQNSGVKVPWNQLVPPTDPDNHADLEEVLGLLVNVRYALTDAVDELSRFRAINHTRFVLQYTAAGLLIAWFGSFISGQNLFLLVLYTLLLIPGAINKGLFKKAEVAAEPYVRIANQKFTELYGIAQQKMGIAKARAEVAVEKGKAKAEVAFEKAKEKVEVVKAKAEDAFDTVKAKAEEAVEAVSHAKAVVTEVVEEDKKTQ